MGWVDALPIYSLQELTTLKALWNFILISSFEFKLKVLQAVFNQ